MSNIFLYIQAHFLIVLISNYVIIQHLLKQGSKMKILSNLMQHFLLAIITKFCVRMLVQQPVRASGHFSMAS